jgi:hypothetical protein
MDNSPSAAIVAAAMQTTDITDATGRTLTLRTLSVIDQLRLLRAIGSQNSDNQPYVNMCQAAASVTSIDGVPQPTPTNERQIDAAVIRIGDAGFAAIMFHMRRQIAELEAAAEAAAAEAAASGEVEGNAPAAGPLAI